MKRHTFAARQREAPLGQRALVEQVRRHAEAVLCVVDATLDSLKEQAPMTTEKLFHGFGQFENGEYARESERRWGNTDLERIAQPRKDIHRNDRLGIEAERRPSSRTCWPRTLRAIRPKAQWQPDSPSVIACTWNGASILAAMRIDA